MCMIGYVRVLKPEMKVKDYETYKAVYCSLCKKLGKNYGILSRFTLSYDFTFLALLIMSLKDGCTEFERKRCAFNPLKKCNYCKDTKDLDMPSASAMIMLYYKILDNIDDERGIKRLGYYLLKPIFANAHKKAKKDYPQIEEIVKEYIDTQRQLEKSGCSELDRVADPTAKALSKILSLCSDDEKQKRVLSRLGYVIGRYIYLLDSACDLKQDIEDGRYNVLKYEVDGKPDKYARERITPQLYTCVNEAGLCFELLSIKKYKDILGNIIYLGLEDTFIKELNK